MQLPVPFTPQKLTPERTMIHMTLPEPIHLVRDGRAIGHHADALDDRGRALPDRVWGWDMPVLADFNGLDGLDKARAWAHRILAEDARVDRVAIRESVGTTPRGGPWRPGAHVEYINR